jgi:molecular chaperone GrpE
MIMSNKKVDEREELLKKSARHDIENEMEDPAAEIKEKGPEEDVLQTQYLRLVADFQNLKRRTEKDKADIYAYANEKIAVDLLNVIDNFERAMAHISESSDKTLAEGMTMIYKLLKEVFEKNGITEINAQGEEFNPNYHHAVLSVKTDGIESGKVAETLQKGYALKGKVIRPAMVKVAE